MCASTEKVLQRRVIELLVGHDALQLRVLRLELLQTPQIRDRHAGIFGFPVVERRIRNAVLAAQIQHLRTGLGFLQNRNDLLFAEPLLLHVRFLSVRGSPSMGPK